MIDDKALVSQVLSGDRQAFRVLIKQHERLVGHMIARLIGQHEDREELRRRAPRRRTPEMAKKTMFFSQFDPIWTS